MAEADESKRRRHCGGNSRSIAVGAALLVTITVGWRQSIHRESATSAADRHLELAKTAARLARVATDQESRLRALRVDSSSLPVTPAVQAAAAERPRGVPFVFVAGVEGTGHHWYKSFFEQCGRDRCRASVLGPLAWQRCAARFNSRMETDAGTLVKALQAAQAEIQRANSGFVLYALNALGGENDRAIAMLKEPAWTQGEGMQSYPNWWGSPNKALQMPSITLIESSLPLEAQFRVVVTVRSADAVIRSVCDKRNFAKSVSGCATEVAILVLGAAAMVVQITAMAPRATCEVFEFEQLQRGDVAAVGKLGAYLGVQDAGAVVKRVNAKLHASSSSSSSLRGKTTPERAALVADLDAAHRTLTQACQRHAALNRQP